MTECLRLPGAHSSLCTSDAVSPGAHLEVPVKVSSGHCLGLEAAAPGSGRPVSCNCRHVCSGAAAGSRAGTHDLRKCDVLPSITGASAPTNMRLPERRRPSSTACTLTLVGPSTCAQVLHVRPATAHRDHTPALWTQPACLVVLHSAALHDHQSPAPALAKVDILDQDPCHYLHSYG